MGASWNLRIKIIRAVTCQSLCACQGRLFQGSLTFGVLTSFRSLAPQPFHSLPQKYMDNSGYIFVIQGK